MAVKDNNLARVKELLNDDVNADYQDGNGQTALMEASRKGYFEIVKVLLEAGEM